MKRILIVSYSQSGQLDRIIETIAAPLRENTGFQIVWERLQPEHPFPFPWPLKRFFDVFAESVLMVPIELKPFSVDFDSRFDLIVIGYTVWYLAPSLPIASFLKSPAAAVMHDTPVITLVNCKDRWLMAQEKVKGSIHQAGGRLIDNAVFVHRGNEATSLVSTLRWLWTGEKGAFWKIFPQAGVDPAEIRASARFGRAVATGLESGKIAAHRSVFGGLGAVKVTPGLIQQGKAAQPHFRVWAKIVRAIGMPGQWQRAPVLVLFALYLGVLVILSLPLTLLGRILIDPFRREKLRNAIRYFEGPSGR